LAEREGNVKSGAGSVVGPLDVDAPIRSTLTITACGPRVSREKRTTSPKARPPNSSVGAAENSIRMAAMKPGIGPWSSVTVPFVASNAITRPSPSKRG
jgi:hypothetical protein